MTWWEIKMKKAQEGMITTMTIDNWLELELVRGINDQGLQKRILLERNPMLQAMISIATQWQSAETAMAQFILDNESSETNSESEETNDIHYKRTPNRSKCPVTNNLNYTHDTHTRQKDENNGWPFTAYFLICKDLPGLTVRANLGDVI